MGNLKRYITTDGNIAIIAIDSTDMAARAEAIHQTSAVVTAALGRLLTAASMMGHMLKGEKSSVTLRIDGKGPTGSIIAVSDSAGNVKGYCRNTVVEIPLSSKGKLDVGTAVGKDGFLTVIRDLGMKEPYIGQIPIVSGEIAEDITSYYAESEQIPAVCALGVLVNPDLTVRAAGGFILQLLPAHDDACVEILEKNIKNLDSITNMLTGGMTPDDICRKVLVGFEIELLDSATPEYRCDCSAERVERALISLGTAELQKLAREQSVTEVCCDFCGIKYLFSRKDIGALTEKIRTKN